MTIAINKIVAQYHAFKIGDIEDGTEDGYIADGPHERDADGDGRISFLEYLHEKYQVVVKEPLSSVEQAFPELSKDQQMEVFFKAVEAGEKADLFISLCRTYYEMHTGHKELPPEEMQKALLQVVRERPEAEVKEVEDLIARGAITSTESLERWLAFSDEHLSSLTAFQRELLFPLIRSLSTDELEQIKQFKEMLVGRCQNEFQAAYLRRSDPTTIEEFMSLLEEETTILDHIQNAGQAEFFIGLYYLKDVAEKAAAFPLAERISSPQVGGIMASLYADQLLAWDTDKRLEYLIPLAEELEQKLASVVEPGAASDAPIYDEADLNPEERQILEELESACQGGENPAAILDIVSKHREAVLPREIAYSGEDQVLSGQQNWNEIFGVFLQGHPGLKEKIIEKLVQQLKEIDLEKDPEAYKQVLRSIPNREILDALLANYDLGLAESLPALWREARAIFGNISQGADKIDYARSLRDELEQQGIPWNEEFSARPFYVPVTFVNLNNMERETTRGLVIPLGEEGKYILAIKNPDTGQWEGRALSDQGTTNILKSFWRQALGEGKGSYFLAYYPKIHVSGGNMSVNIEYEAPEKTYEHFMGKTTGDKNDQDYQKALDNFEAAYGNEDEYLAEQMAELNANLPQELHNTIREEAVPEFDDFMSLITEMDSSGAGEQIMELFGLSEEEFNDYQAKIEKILLETEEPLTPAAFLVRAIEACDGKALLASALCYSLLFTRSGQSSAGNLTAVYPRAFDWDSIDAEDKSGAVYHFMGTFFSAYGTQTCLVRRYYTDASFREKIDGTRETLLKKLTQEENLDFTDTEQQRQLLTLTQYLQLSKGDVHQREVFTMAGIFKEEVMEDQDTSNEVFHDFRGMAAGHAFYQLVWGEELSSNDELFSLNDNRRDAFVDLLANSSNPGEMPLGTMLSAGALLFGLDGLAFSKFI